MDTLFLKYLIDNNYEVYALLAVILLLIWRFKKAIILRLTDNKYYLMIIRGIIYENRNAIIADSETHKFILNSLGIKNYNTVRFYDKLKEHSSFYLKVKKAVDHIYKAGIQEGLPIHVVLATRITNGTFDVAGDSIYKASCITESGATPNLVCQKYQDVPIDNICYSLFVCYENGYDFVTIENNKGISCGSWFSGRGAKAVIAFAVKNISGDLSYIVEVYFSHIITFKDVFPALDKIVKEYTL